MGVEEKAKEAHKEWLREHTRTKVVFQPLSRKVVESDVDTLNSSEEMAKDALGLFLQENTQTKVVVIEKEFKDKICCSESKANDEQVFTFTYDIHKLYENVHMRTSYYGRNLRSEEGTSHIDSIAITLDEWDIFFRLCKEAAVEVYSGLAIYSRDVAKAFSFNSSDNGKIEILFAKRKRSFDFNLLNVLDTLIETAIIYYIIAKWFETIGLQKEYMLYWSYFEAELEKIKKNSRNSKMKKASRPYRPYG